VVLKKNEENHGLQFIAQYALETILLYIGNYHSHAAL